MKNLVVIILLLSATVGHSQGISGIWKGNFRMPAGCFSENNMELRLTVKGDSVTGKTYHYQDKDNYIVKDCLGTYDSVKKTLIIKETRVSDYRMPGNCAICIKKFVFVYSNNGKEILQGRWTGTLLNFGTECMPGTLALYKSNDTNNK